MADVSSDGIRFVKGLTVLTGGGGGFEGDARSDAQFQQWPRPARQGGSRDLLNLFLTSRGRPRLCARDRGSPIVRGALDAIIIDPIRIRSPGSRDERGIGFSLSLANGLSFHGYRYQEKWMGFVDGIAK